MTKTTFARIRTGQTFIPFLGMPNRVFTKITPRQAPNFPANSHCGTCSQQPIMLNATEQEGRKTLYHHFCPSQRVWKETV